jgi:alpha-beta hydrolase superfamily lysophospholipase
VCCKINLRDKTLRRAFGVPVTFGACAGFLHDGGGKVGVLMAPAWGLEEFTIRRGWSVFADLLADAGYCCLRFDWPGAGDSLGDAGSIKSLEIWRDALRAAASFLRTDHGIEKLVLVGHGLGALMAVHSAENLLADALVVMAPQNEGRAGLRELDVWSKMIGSFLRLPLETSENSLNVAGHFLSRGLAAEISALRLDRAPRPLPVLAMLPPGTRAANEWPARLATAGFAVTAVDYVAHEDFVTYSRASTPPLDDFQRVRTWLADTMPPGAKACAREPMVAAALKGTGFAETPLLFGKGDSLFGIVCRPTTRASRAVIVFVNSGDNYHIGWARMHVEFARSLAQQGIASLRIDTGGIGDSHGVDRPAFYDEGQILDVLEAVTVAEKMGLGPVVVCGRCSGGYAAVQTAVRDSRIRGVVAVNPPRLALGPGETFEQVLSGGTSSLADYRRRALSMKTMKEVLSGIPLSTLLKEASRIVKALVAQRLRRFAGPSQLTRTVRSQAETLRARGVVSFLILAENDAGRDELVRHFGDRPAADYENAVVRIVPDAEHNMTARHARKAILNGVVDAVAAIERQSVRLSAA